MKKNLFVIMLCFCVGACTILQQQKTVVVSGKEVAKTKPENQSGSAKEYSKKLGIEIDDSDNQALIKEVAEWIGTPYLYAGNTKKGVDCSGFTQQVYLKIFQKPIHRTADGVYDQSKKVKKTELQQGDLVFFKIDTPKVGHVGLYIKNGYFAHASTAKGVIINHLDETYYAKYFVGGGRFE
jgi:murein DD-endopeptidase / murein LD-carboxypeptidase